MAHTGFFLLVVGSAQSGLSLFVLSFTQLDFFPFLHGCAWLGLLLLAPDPVNSESLLLVRSEASSGPGVMTKLELSSCLSVRGMTSLGFSLSVFSSARLGSFLLVPDMTTPGLLLPLHGPACADFSLFAPGCAHLDSSLLPQGVSKFGFVLLVVGVVTLGPSLSLHGASSAGSLLSVASATMSDFSLLLRGVVWMDLALFPSSMATLGPLLSLRSTSRAELPLPALGPVQMGLLLFLRGLSCVGLLLPVLDCVHFASSPSLRHFFKVDSFTFVCGMSVDFTMLASDFANLDFSASLHGLSWSGSFLPAFASASLGSSSLLKHAVHPDLLLLLCGTCCSDSPVLVSGDMQVSALPALDFALFDSFASLRGVAWPGPFLLVLGMAHLESLTLSRGLSRLESSLSLLNSAALGLSVLVQGST
eukprot:Skav218224  [mRNA]  locus=scaffold1366:79642:80898:- [translate_table: standard]